MPRPIFDKKDEIPKGFEDDYEEKDGKWHFKAGEDVSGLKKTLEAIKQEKADEEKARRKAETDRADLERKLAAATSGDEKDKVSKALKKFDEDLAAAKLEHEKEVTALKGELRTLKLDDKAKAAFLKAGGRPEKADAALRLNKEKLDLADDGRIVIKDEKGAVTSATIEDFWGKTFRAEMAEFYTGTKAAGGNAKGGASTSAARTDGKWDGDAVIADPLGALAAANEEAAAATK